MVQTAEYKKSLREQAIAHIVATEDGSCIEEVGKRATNWEIMREHIDNRVTAAGDREDSDRLMFCNLYGSSSSLQSPTIRSLTKQY